MSNILEQLSQLVQQAVTQAVKAGTLPEINPDDLKIEISKPNKNFGGDYSCGVALTLTRALKRPPMQIGEAIEAAFPEAPDIVEKIWLTPPGFINFKLAHRWLTNNLKLIRDQGSSYADQDFGGGERVMIEFVSVNPTGPLHVGHARGAILGSALANILTKTGHAVWCEYYVNDAGTQNRIFQEAMYNLIHPKQSLAQYKVPPPEIKTKGKENDSDRIPYFDLADLEKLEEDVDEMELENALGTKIPLNPKNKEDYFIRAEAYEERNKLKRAAAELTKAIERYPDDADVYYTRGNFYLNVDDNKKALADYIEALQREGEKNTNGYEIVADMLGREGEHSQIIAIFTERLNKYPDDSEARSLRGNAHFNEGNYDQAIVDYTELIRLYAKHATDNDPFNHYGNAYFDRGVAYFMKGDYDQAIADYTHVISLNPNEVNAYFERGAAHFNKRDWGHVVADYTEVIERDSKNKESYFRRGMAYANLADHRLASEDFTEAIRLDPYYSELYERRSNAYEKMGKSDLAKDDQATAKLYSESYTGEYMNSLKEQLLKTQPDLESLNRDDFMARTNRKLAGRVVLDIKKTLDNLGIDYDQWFYESELMGEDGAWERMFNELEKKGYIEERDGAQWFLATKFGAEKDVVVVRSDVRKEHTYFATDFAYHLNKLGPKPPYRNFSRTINIWGGDHHGHVIRLAAAMQAVGIDPARVQVQTVQIVHFKADDKKLKLSKRKGQIITIDDLLDEVGKDACRYEFLNRSHNAQMTFDIEQAKRQSIENPVYYIQYAHARLCSVLERGAVLSGWDRSAEFDLNLLKHPNERALMFHLTELPMILRTSAERLEPHLVTFYLYELARRFQTFYEECRVISDDKALSDARLLLAYSTKTVLNEVLRLLGISAPERMDRSEAN